MAVNRRNLKYQPGSPLKPEKLGDRQYAQDGVRDMNYLIDRSGKAGATAFFPDAGGTLPYIVFMTAAVSSSGNNLITIPGASGLMEYDVEVPLSYASFPPTKQTDQILAVIGFAPAIADISLTTTGQISDNLLVNPNGDGATTNYVKLRYKELDGNTRNRAKSTGSWAYEVIDSFEFVIDDVAPTNKDLQLASFIWTTDGTPVITAEARSKQLTIQTQHLQTAATSEEKWTVPLDQPFPGTALRLLHGDGSTPAENKLDVNSKDLIGLLASPGGETASSARRNDTLPFRDFEVIVASLTFTVPDGVFKLFVEVLGAGGGGGEAGDGTFSGDTGGAGGSTSFGGIAANGGLGGDGGGGTLGGARGGRGGLDGSGGEDLFAAPGGTANSVIGGAGGGAGGGVPLSAFDGPGGGGNHAGGGAGGNGGSNTNEPGGGGGGQGEIRASVIAVTPGDPITATIGAGGVGGDGTSTAGRGGGGGDGIVKIWY